MYSSSSPTIDEVIGNIMEEVLKERAEKPKNEETAPEKVREENETEDAMVFYTEKRADSFRKSLSKKGSVEVRGFREIVSPFKEEV